LAQWKITISHMLTDRTRANGLGYVDRAKMERTLDFIKRYQDVKGDMNVDDIYTSKFLNKISVQ
jgi:hypothetical protein